VTICRTILGVITSAVRIISFSLLPQPPSCEPFLERGRTSIARWVRTHRTVDLGNSTKPWVESSGSDPGDPSTQLLDERGSPRPSHGGHILLLVPQFPRTRYLAQLQLERSLQPAARLVDGEGVVYRRTCSSRVVGSGTEANNTPPPLFLRGDGVYEAPVSSTVLPAERSCAGRSTAPLRVKI